IAFNGNTAQTYLKTGGTINGALDFIIKANASVDFGTSVLDGTSGAFTLEANGTLATANTGGISTAGTNIGTIRNIGARTYSTAANYIYNGTSLQTVGNGLPNTIASLTINN